MNTCKVVITILICFLFVEISIAEENVVGVWRFVKEIDYKLDGSKIDIVPPDGYVGQIIYTADGFMSAQIFPTGRTWKPATATIKDLKSTLDLSTSYFGRYEIDPVKKQVTHKVAGNLDPTAETTNYVRDFKFSGDTLILTGPWEYNGEKLKFEITWQRLRK
jgi:lipocalin-like protein